MRILERECKTPKAFKSHKPTQMITTAFRKLLMVLCMGMSRFTSQSRKPTTINTIITCTKGILILSFFATQTLGLRLEVSLYFILGAANIRVWSLLHRLILNFYGQSGRVLGSQDPSGRQDKNRISYYLAKYS
jgi:hypothetical protein